MNKLLTAFVQRVLSPLTVFWFERVWGWHMPGRFPDLPRYMFVAEYHTSNWDVVVLLYAMAKERRLVRFIIKKEVEKWPVVGPALRWMGAIFIDRDSPMSALRTLLKTFRTSERCILLICPSGTRGYSEGWQPGFYYLANKLNLPLVLGAPDFGTKTVKLAEPMIPSGDIHHDMEIFAAFYESVTARHPERATPVQLLPEGDDQRQAIAT